VSVEGLRGQGLSLAVPWGDVNGTGLTTSSSWPVSYDPNHVTETLRIVSPFDNQPLAKSTIMWILIGGAALLIIFWIVNLKLRNNHSFRELAGAGDIADLASQVFAR
jgi:hypothetical protein